VKVATVAIASTVGASFQRGPGRHPRQRLPNGATI
jgi:hypothetical protein